MMKIIKAEQLNANVFKMIGDEWMLVTACTTSKDEEGKIITGRANTMTASWGGMGILWNKAVATIYIRPTRFTKEIIDSSETFSLSVLGEKYKTALNYCGSHSGRNEDKIKQCKLDVEYMNYTPWIKQAKIAFICKKLYAQELDPNCFTDPSICDKNYRKNDFHTMYIAEIQKVLVDQREQSLIKK